VNHLEFHQLPDDALIRLYLLFAWGLIPFSASTLWRKCRSGAFPPPVRVSAGITAWRVGDIRQWLKDPQRFRAAGLSAKQLGVKS
jgi:prophage regulatory protein